MTGDGSGRASGKAAWTQFRPFTHRFRLSSFGHSFSQVDPTQFSTHITER